MNILYISDSSNVSKKIDFYDHADDKNIVHPDKSESEMNEMLGDNSAWLVEKNVFLNYRKMELVLFENGRDGLKLGDATKSDCEFVENSGIFSDRTLDLEDQPDAVLEKLSCHLYVCMYVCKTLLLFVRNKD